VTRNLADMNESIIKSIRNLYFEAESCLGHLSLMALNVLLFVIIVTPNILKPLKFIILAYLLLAAIARIALIGRIKIHSDILILLSLIVGFNAITMFRGALIGAPGALRSGTVLLVWPILSVILSSLATKYVLYSSLKVLSASFSILAMYGLAYIIYGQTQWPVLGFLDFLPFNQSMSVWNGGMKITFFGMTSLMFGIPFMMANLVSSLKGMPLKNRKTSFLAVLIVVVFGGICGRRALQVLTVASPLIAITVLRSMYCKDYRIGKVFNLRTICATGLMIIVFAVFGFMLFDNELLQSLPEYIMKGFDTGVDAGAAARGRQFGSLIAGWAQNPYFGIGYGAVADGVLRSMNQPWSYELSYLAQLYHSGLVGILLHGFAVAWIFMRSISISRKSVEWLKILVPLNAGMIGFLLANASNPYLGTFDSMWVIFLPVAAINAALMEETAESSSDTSPSERRLISN
jgi:hypothetical protein